VLTLAIVEHRNQQVIQQDERAAEAAQQRQADDSGLDDRAEGDALIKRTEASRKARRQEARKAEAEAREAEAREAEANGRVYASDHQDDLISVFADSNVDYLTWCRMAAEYDPDTQGADKDPWITGCAGYASDLWDTLHGR
jgi:hypothetical protein